MRISSRPVEQLSSREPTAGPHMCCPAVQQHKRPPNECDIAARTDSNTPLGGPVISHKRGAAVPLSERRRPVSGCHNGGRRTFCYLNVFKVAPGDAYGFCLRVH